MRIFYGAAIQGLREIGDRSNIHRAHIELIKSRGNEVVSEHVTGRTREEIIQILERETGLPSHGIERTRYIRRMLIKAVEDMDTEAAVFEVSVPSHGTSNEFTHAYLRPRMGLPRIPILVLYEQGYWPNGLSTMIKGITTKELPNVQVKEYTDLYGSLNHLSEFLRNFD